jgi:hypothetical protein
MADDLTKTRIAENQSRFREANERIEVAAENMGIVGAIPFICECSREGCVEIASLTLDEYEEIRQHPRRFFCVLGHEDVAEETGAGTEVSRNDRYVVVDKVGVAGEIAKERYEDLTSSDVSPPED